MSWEIVKWLISILRSYALQLFVAGMLFCVHIPRRKFFLPVFGLLVILLFSLQVLFDLGYLEALDLGGWFNLYFLIVFGVELLLIMFCFRCDLRQTFFIGSACWIMQHFLASALRAVEYYVLGDVPRGGAWLLLLFSVYLVLSVAVYFAFHKIFIRRILDNGGVEGFANMRNNQVTVLTAIILFIVYLLSLLTADSGKDAYHLIYACCCCALLLFIQFDVFVRNVDKEKTKMVRQLLQIEHEQRALSKENLKILNCKCHDLKHQISDIRKLVNDELLDKKLQEMYDAVLVYDSFVKTGNSALDILLTEKKLYCEKYGISLACMADGRRMDFISEEDIYSLFGNALDNAIESVSARSDLLVIHIDNYCADGERIVFVDGLLQTTKPDSLYHGLGMPSMRFLTEKYGGTMTASVQDKLFVLNIVIPIPAKREENTEKKN